MSKDVTIYINQNPPPKFSLAIDNPVSYWAEIAKMWAIKMDGKVFDEDYSAKYYATQSINSAEIASAQAATAATKASEASTFASNASLSATNAATSETNASTSANTAYVWAEGDDEDVEALGGTHSAKGWANYVVNNAPTVTAEQTETGAIITTEDLTHGEVTVELFNGTDGETGVGIESIEKTSTSGLVDTYTITYTDENTTTFNVTNGADGQDGADGEDGFSPIATVSKVGKIATISITDKDGTTTETVSDGEDGADGTDGISPIANVVKTGNTATITITDATGTTTAEIHDGTSGASALSELTDVSLTTLSDNQVLKYNATTQKWENGTGGGGSVEIDDTTITKNTDNELQAVSLVNLTSTVTELNMLSGTTEYTANEVEALWESVS